MTYFQPPPNVLPLQYYFNVTILDADYARLGPNLSSWARLNELLILGQFPLEDLKRLLILELSQKNRKQVIIKLQSRISTAETKHVTKLVTHVLSRTQDREAGSQVLQAPRSVPTKIRVSRTRRRS